jgi:hypothetical protein
LGQVGAVAVAAQYRQLAVASEPDQQVRLRGGEVGDERGGVEVTVDQHGHSRVQAAGKPPGVAVLAGSRRRGRAAHAGALYTMGIARGRTVGGGAYSEVVRERLVLAGPIALFGLYGLYVYWMERRESQVLYISLGILGVATVIALIPLRLLFSLFSIGLGIATIYSSGDYAYPVISIVLGVVFVVFGIWMMFTRNSAADGDRRGGGGGGDPRVYDFGDGGGGPDGD